MHVNHRAKIRVNAHAYFGPLSALWYNGSCTSTAWTYTITAAITDGDAAETDASFTATVSATPTTLKLLPGTATVLTGGAWFFRPDLRDQFGWPCDGDVTLTVTGTGTLSGGLFTAPWVGETDTITATCGTLSGVATVTVSPRVTGHWELQTDSRYLYSGIYGFTTCEGSTTWIYPNNVGNVTYSWNEDNLHYVFDYGYYIRGLNSIPGSVNFNWIDILNGGYLFIGTPVQEVVDQGTLTALWQWVPDPGAINSPPAQTKVRVSSGNTCSGLIAQGGTPWTATMTNKMGPDSGFTQGSTQPISGLYTALEAARGEELQLVDSSSGSMLFSADMSTHIWPTGTCVPLKLSHTLSAAPVGDPSVQVSSPADKAVARVGDGVSLMAGAQSLWDGNNVTSIQLLIDGAVVASTPSASSNAMAAGANDLAGKATAHVGLPGGLQNPLSATWTAIGGTHTITATAGYADGTTADSAPVTVYCPTLAVAAGTWTPATANVGDTITGQVVATYAPGQGANDGTGATYVTYDWETEQVYESDDGGDKIGFTPYAGDYTLGWYGTGATTSFAATFTDPGYYILKVKCTATLHDSANGMALGDPVIAYGYVGGSAGDVGDAASPAARGAAVAHGVAHGVARPRQVGGAGISASALKVYIYCWDGGYLPAMSTGKHSAIAIDNPKRRGTNPIFYQFLPTHFPYATISPAKVDPGIAYAPTDGRIGASRVISIPSTAARNSAMINWCNRQVGIGAGCAFGEYSALENNCSEFVLGALRIGSFDLSKYSRGRFYLQSGDPFVGTWITIDTPYQVFEWAETVPGNKVLMGGKL